MSNLIPGNPYSNEELVLEQLAYQTALYLDIPDTVGTNANSTNLYKLIEFAKRADLNTAQKDALTNLEQIIDKNPKLGLSKLTNPSWADETKYDPAGMQACVFVNADGEEFVSFRGTPKGAWMDNGYAITGIKDSPNVTQWETENGSITVSPMQAKALEYVDEYLKQREADGKTGKVYLDGHSKGGNEAQLAALLFSEHVEAAYINDGQGFSNIFYDELEAILGKEGAKEARKKKRYCGHALAECQ